MAQFPSREADVAALAGTMINGLTEQAEHFPASPVSVETLQESLHAYNRARDSASSAQGGAAEAAMSQTFLLSNMAPQTPNLNRDLWRRLEVIVTSWRGSNYSLAARRSA